MASAGLTPDPERVLADLRELRELTEDEHGAQRLCWTDTWARARRWFDSKLEGLAVERVLDPAGNKWVILHGDDPRSLVLGGHIDSVPNGGWLDGSLGLLAGLEVLRALAARGRPPVTVKVVDWADEEGARFGWGMLGSSAASGTLDLQAIGGLEDRDGNRLPDVLGEYGVEVAKMPGARASLDGVLGYVELHIEQGPVLEDLGLPLAVVRGTVGVERHVVRFTGQAAHAGPTPMDRRREALAASSRLVLGMREMALQAGAKFTAGRCVTRPGVATVVAEEVDLTVDQRHPDAQVLADCLTRAQRLAREIAESERVQCEWSRLWDIEPIAFDHELIEIAQAAVFELSGHAHTMDSGALHDAAEVARAGIPTVMLFVQSLGGLSHAKLEDTREEDLILAVKALASTVERSLAWAADAARTPTPGDGSV
ncbi:MAG TPA: Zn-dependent hydrolase [Solirubrobacteraceae bacterium]|jgi:hydantoinase/carbamoylase family amidase|nr:Zn-dependent hydrolase [Solirubrobacteraceae bacterium]